jgi:hypothetical protein
MADDFERIRRTTDSAGFRALLGMAAVAGFFVYAGKLFSSPQGRRGYWDQVRQAAAERRERDAWHERKNRRIRAKLDYFDGRGGELYRQRALIRIGPEPGFPDARYERRPAGFRHAAFHVQSLAAGASLDVDWDVADRDGRLRLELTDGRAWRFGFHAGQSDLHQYDKADHDFEMAGLASRLLATPGSPFSTITFVRPEASAIRDQIWQDHVAEHPELAEEDWPW